MRQSERKFVESMSSIFSSLKERDERDLGKARMRVAAIRTNYPILYRKFFSFGNSTIVSTAGFKKSKMERLI